MPEKRPELQREAVRATGEERGPSEKDVVEHERQRKEDLDRAEATRKALETVKLSKPSFLSRVLGRVVKKVKP